MRTIDALNILSITKSEITFSDVKKAYHDTCRAFHPDINPAGLATMKAVNEAYEELSKATFPISIDSQSEFRNYGEELNNALNSIISFTDLSIEICGFWAWVSGPTSKYKSTLKESGFKWSRNKKMWYFRSENQKRRFFRGSSSIDEIRTKYGSEKVAFRYRKALA